MKPYNKLSESLCRSQPVHAFKQKENHTPHEAISSLKNKYGKFTFTLIMKS